MINADGIDSLGGAIISSDGGYNYPSSGGYIGGLTLPETSNYSGYTGVGSSGYNSFTPIVSAGNGSGFDQPSGGISTSVGNTPVASQSAGLSLSNFYNPQSPGVAYKGLGGITGGGNSLLGSIQSIFSAYQNGQLTNVQALDFASTLQGYLYDPSHFYQAQHGKDAAELGTLKQQAQALLNAIASWVKPKAPDTVNDNPTSGGTGGGSGGGTDNNQTILSQLAGLLGGGGATNFEAPPTLFQMTPTGADTTSTGGSIMTGKNLIILAAVAAIGYFVWKKYF